MVTASQLFAMQKFKDLLRTEDMARSRYGLLGFVALATIAATSFTPALAEDAVRAPAQVQDEQIAKPGPAVAQSVSSNARAEIVRPAAPAKPKTTQVYSPARPIVIAERDRCWAFCGRQMVLMLGVAY
jgi:uncharacterized membrane protein